MNERKKTGIKKRWINTKVVYDSFGKEIYSEGYWYDGPLALLTTPTRESADWAFYQDGPETSATIIGSKNTNPTKGDLSNDTLYQLRIGVEETAGGGWMNAVLQLEYSLNSGGWNHVDAASSVVQSLASGEVTIVDGNDTTQRITAYTFDTTNQGIDEVNGISGGSDPDLNNNGFECLFCFQIIGSDVSDNDTIDFKVTDSVTTLDMDTYQQTDPRLTVEVVAGSLGIPIAAFHLNHHIGSMT